MFRNVLENIGGVEIYPVISLLIFFAVFIGMLVWFFLADKEMLKELSLIPLDDNSLRENSTHVS